MFRRRSGHALSWHMAQAPGCPTRSWRLSRVAWPRAGSPACAISSLTWSAARKRTDGPAVAHSAVRAAVGAASDLLPSVPLLAGGKSFGGGMTSHAQADAPLPGVLGLAFFGFPLHPAGRPSADRALHLAGVFVPMLFLQGARDALADPEFLLPTVRNLGSRATLWRDRDANHSFHVPARSGRNDAQVLSAAMDAFGALAELLLL